MEEVVRLVKYYPNEDIALKWYQDITICKQVDNIDSVYDVHKLKRMYAYLDTHGKLFYIEYDNKLIGDCCLLDSGEIAVVISKPYQNLHIGRKCILQLITLAKQMRMSKVYARIFSFNVQSQKMFTSIGFQKVDEEMYVYRIDSV